MLVLVRLAALAVPVAAVPTERRDILGLLRGDRPAVVSTQLVLETLATSPRSSASPPTSSSLSDRWTATPTSRSSPPAPTSTRATLTPAPSVPPASAEGQVTDRASKTWQIIGIVIISVLFIATSITCAMFFDRLWSFLKDLVRCASRPPLSEEFIPHDGGSLAPWPANLGRHKGESLREDAFMHTTRELPWNTDTEYWNHRRPSRTSDPPTA